MSSDAVVQARTNAPTFPYPPQQYQAGPSMGYPTYDPSFPVDPSLMGMSSSRPADPPMSRRPMTQPLGIDVHAASQYVPQHQGTFPLTPQSAPFSSATIQQAPFPNHAQSSAINMKRVGSQPLPGAKAQAGQPVNYYHPHLYSTHTMSESERQRIRAEVASKRVGMAEASVMQPYVPPVQQQHGQMVSPYLADGQFLQHQQQLLQQQQGMAVPIHPSHGDQIIMGWDSPLAPAPPPLAPHLQAHGSAGPVLTNAPLATVQHPASGFYPNSHPRSTSASVPHRVHPPPHPGPSQQQLQQQQAQRPIARMPSGTPKARARTASTAPKTKPRASPGRKKGMPAAGIETWGGFTFANYTPEDGAGLLKGVAPSGSQSKRKREASAALLSVPMANQASGSDISADADDDARSKRSRSSGSSSNHA